MDFGKKAARMMEAMLNGLSKVPCGEGWYRRGGCGMLSSGDAVEVVEIGIGMISATFLSYGARWVGWHVPDNIVLRYSTLEDYDGDACYLGSLVGRVCNRTAKGEIRIGDVAHRLAINENRNHHHGGIRGFDKYIWHVDEIGVDDGGQAMRVVMSRTSPAGEQGYPGQLLGTVEYVLRSVDGRHSVEVRIRSFAPSADTIANLTTHGYFNLDGAASQVSVLEHHVRLPVSEHYLETDAESVPTGRLSSVRDNPILDLRSEKRIRETVPLPQTGPPGFDHYFVRDDCVSEGVLVPPHPNPELPMIVVAMLRGANGRVMEVATDQPGFQFYTGNFLDGVFQRHAGLCVEPSGLIDAATKSHFLPITLPKGKTLIQRTVYSVW